MKIYSRKSSTQSTPPVPKSIESPNDSWLRFVFSSFDESHPNIKHLLNGPNYVEFLY
jgi:hypothetical protein